MRTPSPSLRGGDGHFVIKLPAPAVPTLPSTPTLPAGPFPGGGDGGGGAEDCGELAHHFGAADALGDANAYLRRLTGSFEDQSVAACSAMVIVHRELTRLLEEVSPQVSDTSYSRLRLCSQVPLMTISCRLQYAKRLLI